MVEASGIAPFVGRGRARGCGAYSSEPSLAVLHPISETPAASVPAMITVLNYTLSWTSLSRASSYNIEETLPAGTISAYSGVTGTSKAFTQSAPGTWRYRVQGCNSSGCGPWSAQVSVTINLPQPPAVPTGLTVTQVNSQLCRVTWSTVSGASYYNLSQAGLVMKISGVPIYEFDGACARPYKVRACTAQGTCSAWSATK